MSSEPYLDALLMGNIERLFLHGRCVLVPVKKEKTSMLKELREQNVGRTEESFHPLRDRTPDEYLTAVQGELGSVAHLLKKARNAAGKVPEMVAHGQADVELGMRRDKLAKELADTLIYLDLLAARLGIDLEDAVVKAFNAKSEEIGSRRLLGGWGWKAQPPERTETFGFTGIKERKQ